MLTLSRISTKNDQIKKIANILGLDEAKLRNLIDIGINKGNINDYGRFDELKNTVDKVKAKVYFEKMEGTTIPPFKVNIRIHNTLEKFIIDGGFDL